MIRKELLEELLAGRDPSEVFGADGLLDELKRSLAEHILDAELNRHLETEKAEADRDAPRNQSLSGILCEGRMNEPHTEFLTGSFFRARTRHNQHVPAAGRRIQHLRRTVAVLTILQTA